MPTEVRPFGKVAIIGIGCRMPPAGSSLAAFWKFLMKGGNALRAIKKDRWDVRQFFDADQTRPGKSYAPKAASLDADVRQFDPLAFNISPREAAVLDPQQRLLLEVTWEAFEDAGLPLERMSGSSTGVFIGGFCLDHLIHQSQPSNRYLINAHSPGGVMMTVLSNRISHVFNLRGPSLTIDTACSSSLVALHYACQSLRSGEVEMALAGGVNVMGRPEFPIIMSKGHFLSHHGECHAFDETAAGYARGEGAGVLVLKRFEDAVADGDTIHAVIAGSGVNQDGHTDGISLPNSEAQERLVRQVYGQAGVPCGEVDYVEAHGTGTQAGDSAELGALNRNFAQGRKAKLLVGSVKTNIGHLEAAAGVAGIIKAIGVLKFRQVPKNLHFAHPNPKIPFSEYELEVVKETRALPKPEEKETLYVGINSFGYGGTNAHILMESAPPAKVVPTLEEEGPRLIPFSAHSDKALRDLAGKYAFLLGGPQVGSLGDLAHTAAFRRSHLSRRMVAIAGTVEELRDQLIAASTGQPHEGVVLGGKGGESNAPLAFVYTGMGPQWWGMGQELVRQEKIVSDTLDEIDGYFRPMAGWSLKEAMMAEESASRMERTELAQPANFALQVALTRLWESYGIRPTAVVGHSVGEVTSAYVAGVYTLKEAVQVSYHRSRLQQTMAGKGAMLAVGLPEEEALGLIAELPGVSVAAVNSFSAVTLSGDGEQLKSIAAELERRGVFQKFLRVEVAYHSPQMDPLREELLAALADLSPQPARLPLYSTAYGKIVPAGDWTAEYWWQNVRKAVHFAPAIQAMFADGYAMFLEIGPHPVLGNSIKECAAHLERKVTCFVSLRRKEPEAARMRLTLAELYCEGYDPDWRTLAPREGRFFAPPQYSWQREQYWVESERSRMERLGLPGPVYLNRSLLGPKPCWEVEVNRNYFPFLFDHGVQDQTVFAGMGYIEAALSLSELVHERAAVSLENVSFERVLIVDYSKLQYLMTEFDREGGRFIISSRVEGEEESVQRHCRGRMLPLAEPRPEMVDLAVFREACAEVVTEGDFHERLRKRELHYGPTFTQPVAEVLVGDGRFLMKIDASGITDENHRLHPALFDAALRGVLYCAGGERLFVPFGFEQFQYFSRPEGADCHACGRIISQSDTLIVADVWLTDAKGRVHAKARRLSLQAIDMAAKAAAESPFYQWEWKVAPLDKRGELAGSSVLILADEEGELTRGLVELLPEAAVVAEKSAGGMNKAHMAQVLSVHSDRRHVIVLWGAQEGVSLDVNERVIGLLQALGERAEGSDVTLVTRGAKTVAAGDDASLAAASLSAIGLVGQNEFNSVMTRAVDFAAGSFSPADLVAEIAADSRGDIAYRGSERFENALLPFAFDETEKLKSVGLEEPVELRWSTNGRLESLGFSLTERVAPQAGEIELRIHSVALNYKDVLKVEGQLHPLVLEQTFWGTDLGMECAGVVERCGPRSQFAPGDKVVTILQRGFRSWATIPETFAVKLPPNLGMEAAAIPVVYLTAYRGLVEIARLQAGEKVLIHNATGGLGLAAINIAQWIGAEIFATAGSEEKRRYLAELGITQVFSSRDVDFASQILEITDQAGVDVVIGAQAGQIQHASLGLLRVNGRYIEVGKKDIAEDNGLPLRAFNRNILFASVDIDRLAHECPQLMQKTMRSVMEYFASGVFSQKSVRSYPAAQIKEAFFEMARSRHIGKLVIDFSQGEVEVPEQSAGGPIIKSDGAYIVTGGTSGFGVATGVWLAEQGAGKVILVSRSGKTAPGIEDTLRLIESKGAQAEALSVDVTDPEAVQAMIVSAQSGPFVLRGVIHGAMVLDDAMMEDLTEERFRRVFDPKVRGALNLAAAPLGADLDFLVFYSSISAVVGNRGQTNYVAANAYLDGLAHRMRRGAPVLSINWGALAESGVVARDERLGTILSSAGITGLSNHAALEALEKVIRLGVPQMGVFLVDWRKWHEAHPHLANDPRFRELRIRSQEEAGDDVSSQIRQALADCSKEQRLRALEDHLQDVLAATLKMSKDTVPVNRKINEMGVDSLMVLELSLGIKERIGVSFSAMEFLKGPTLEQLAAMAESRLWSN